MKRLIFLAIIIAVAYGAACVVSSGTMVLTYEVEGLLPVTGDMYKTHLDLTSEKDYEKHKDKIESVDAISIVGDIVTTGAVDSVEILIANEDYSNISDVRAHGTKILVTPGFDATKSLHLDYEDGLRLIRNLPALKDEIENSGNFYIYGIANGAGYGYLTFDLGVIITLTAGL